MKKIANCNLASLSFFSWKAHLLRCASNECELYALLRYVGMQIMILNCMCLRENRTYAKDDDAWCRDTKIGRWMQSTLPDHDYWLLSTKHGLLFYPTSIPLCFFSNCQSFSTQSQLEMMAKIHSLWNLPRKLDMILLCVWTQSGQSL